MPDTLTNIIKTKIEVTFLLWTPAVTLLNSCSCTLFCSVTEKSTETRLHQRWNHRCLTETLRDCPEEKEHVCTSGNTEVAAWLLLSNTSCKFLHTSMMLSLTVINQMTKIAVNKTWNGEIPFQQKNQSGKKRSETFGLSGLIFPLAFQLKHMGEMTCWFYANFNHQKTLHNF